MSMPADGLGGGDLSRAITATTVAVVIGRGTCVCRTEADSRPGTAMRTGARTERNCRPVGESVTSGRRRRVRTDTRSADPRVIACVSIARSTTRLVPDRRRWATHEKYSIFRIDLNQNEKIRFTKKKKTSTKYRFFKPNDL